MNRLNFFFSTILLLALYFLILIYLLTYSSSRKRFKIFLKNSPTKIWERWYYQEHFSKTDTILAHLVLLFLYSPPSLILGLSNQSQNSHKSPQNPSPPRDPVMGNWSLLLTIGSPLPLKRRGRGQNEEFHVIKRKGEKEKWLVRWERPSKWLLQAQRRYDGSWTRWWCVDLSPVFDWENG